MINRDHHDNNNVMELDRTASGKLRVNVVSITNLIALLGLVGVAIGTWTSLSNSVSVMAVRVETAQKQLENGRIEQVLEMRELRSRVDLMQGRLGIMETVVNRIDQKLARP